MSAWTMHYLKCWPEPFRALASGEKCHETRRADRPFQVGDFLALEEWNPETGEYTGATLVVRVTYISRGGEWGLPAELCVMSVQERELFVRR